MLMRYVQICERCGRVFPREDAECPKCHFNKAEHEKEILAAQQKKKAQRRHNDATKDAMINEYIKVSKSGKYHVCTRCNLAFIKELDYCPRCDHFEDEDDEDDFYTSESTEQSYTACDICPHPYCNAGGFCPLLD